MAHRLASLVPLRVRGWVYVRVNPFSGAHPGGSAGLPAISMAYFGRVNEALNLWRTCDSRSTYHDRGGRRQLRYKWADQHLRQARW